MAIVPTHNTGGSGTGSDRDAWIRSRHAALVAVLRSQGVANAWDAASGIVAQWANESGWGHGEYGHNFGNVRQTAACPNAHLLQGSDDAVPRPYCDYATLDEGVRATVALLHAPRYAAAWNYLTSTGDGVGYYDRLMRGGWNDWSQASLDSYRSIHARVVRTVGPDPGGSGMSPWVYGILAVAVGAAAYLIVAPDDRPPPR